MRNASARNHGPVVSTNRVTFWPCRAYTRLANPAIPLCAPWICHAVVPGLEFSSITHRASVPSGPGNVAGPDGDARRLAPLAGERDAADPGDRPPVIPEHPATDAATRAAALARPPMSVLPRAMTPPHAPSGERRTTPGHSARVPTLPGGPVLTGPAFHGCRTGAGSWPCSAGPPTRGASGPCHA